MCKTVERERETNDSEHRVRQTKTEVSNRLGTGPSGRDDRLLGESYKNEHCAKYRKVITGTLHSAYVKTDINAEQA